MGARLRRSGKAGAVAILVAIALVGSAWLAFATTAPRGGSGSYPGTTTTTTAASTTTTTVCPQKPHKPPHKGGWWGKSMGMDGKHDHGDDNCPPPPCKPIKPGWGHGGWGKSFGMMGHGDGDHCPPPPPPPHRPPFKPPFHGGWGHWHGIGCRR